MKVLKEGSFKYNVITRIENIMLANEVMISGDNLKIHFNDKSYKIGKTSDVFPRCLDEMYILIDE